jgi:hypothetical protein
MRKIRIARYVLLGVGLLLVTVMFLPGRAMPPPQLERGSISEKELKEIKKV